MRYFEKTSIRRRGVLSRFQRSLFICCSRISKTRGDVVVNGGNSFYLGSIYENVNLDDPKHSKGEKVVRYFWDGDCSQTRRWERP